jgi:integrase
MLARLAWHRQPIQKPRGFVMARSDWPRPNRIIEGTFATVIRAYLGSEKFKKGLEPSTQKLWRDLLAIAEHPDALGAISIMAIRPALVQAFLDGLSATPGRQKNARTVLKAVEKYALVRDLLPYPIMTGTEVIGTDDGHEPWPDAMVNLALDHARADLARVVALGAHTGQRGSDIVRMRWADIEDQDDPITGERRQGINVIQKKTGVRLWIPFTRELAATVEEWLPTRRPPFFLVLKPDGSPYTRNQLSVKWNDERDSNPALAPISEAGLVLHGLRSTAVVRARKSGATVLQISSMFGMSEPMVARYSRLADQREMALAAVHRLDGTRIEQTSANKSKNAD